MEVKLLLFIALMLSVTAMKVLCKDDQANITNITKTTKKLVRSRRKWNSPIRYYPNSINIFRLLISGDIETNPGPSICQTCSKTIRINSKRVECIVCFNLNHLRCIKGSAFLIQNSRIVFLLNGLVLNAC